MRVYKLSIAVIGTLLPILATSLSAGYAAPVFFPLYLVVAYIALWLISKSPTAWAPIGAGILAAAALGIATFTYIANHGNWNQPGQLWVFIAATAGILLLGVNVFAIYLRHRTSNVAAYFTGPLLLISSAIAYTWLVNVDATRADLFMFRADKLLAALYTILAAALILDRRITPRSRV